MNEQWKQLKDTIVDIRDNNEFEHEDVTLMCRFLVNYMDVLEKQMQEPCKNTIDRQAVLDMIQMRMSGKELYKAVYDLPPVNPQPKTGHWIEHPEIETSTPEYLMFYECSECGNKQCFCKSDIHKKRFCGNCGCRMVEPQERSDKE